MAPAQPPPHFPANVQYLTTPVPSRLLPAAHRQTFCTPCPPHLLPNPPPRIAIRTISDPRHPANGQSGLFNASNKALPRGTWIRDYVGWVHTEGEADPTSGYDLALDRIVTDVVDPETSAARRGRRVRRDAHGRRGALRQRLPRRARLRAPQRRLRAAQLGRAWSAGQEGRAHGGVGRPAWRRQGERDLRQLRQRLLAAAGGRNDARGRWKGRQVDQEACQEQERLSCQLKLSFDFTAGHCKAQRSKEAPARRLMPDSRLVFRSQSRKHETCGTAQRTAMCSPRQTVVLLGQPLLQRAFSTTRVVRWLSEEAVGRRRLPPEALSMPLSPSRPATLSSIRSHVLAMHRSGRRLRENPRASEMAVSLSASEGRVEAGGPIARL